jgi:hypothetical protein
MEFDKVCYSVVDHIETFMKVMQLEGLHSMLKGKR